MDESVTRLHITPLTPDLLPAILGKSLLLTAKNVSYHSIQTALENSYGYVDLPKMEAEKIKKKLNGAILKGSKIKIEEARPTKRKHVEPDGDTAANEGTGSRKSKRTKKDPKVLDAHELSPDRKVKRGWTVPKAQRDKRKKDKSTKSQAPSKYTEKSEVLFRTKVPPNKTPATSKGKKHKKSDQPDIVHEFEKSTTVPSFLRNEAGGGNMSVEYKDGEGWVDHDGNVVEVETQKASKKRMVANMGLEIDVVKAQALNRELAQTSISSPLERDDEERSSSSEDSPSDSASVSSSEKAEKAVRTSEDEPTTYADETSSSGSSSSSLEEDSDSSASAEEDEANVDGDSAEGKMKHQGDITGATAAEKRSRSRPSSSSSSSLSPSPSPLPLQVTEGSAKEVHPLEALFKKPQRIDTQPVSTQNAGKTQNTAATGTPKPPRLELSTSFSFFANEDSDIESESEEKKKEPPVHTPHTQITNHLLSTLPMTPFSTQDFHRRRLRSAAPTPDTADIRKSTGYGSLILGEDDPDDVLSDYEEDGNNNKQQKSKRSNDTDTDTQHAGGESKDTTTSEFEKKFWENRGENNRAWKARRRAVLKEKRQRENRRTRPVGF